MSKRDYYEILEVERVVEEGGLKTAYRKLALRYHPDRNPDDPGAEESFKEVSEAYAVLSDPEKRARYDRFGHAGVGGPGGGGPGADFGDLGGFTDLFNDLFGDMFGGGRGAGFGGGRRAGRGQRGADLRYNLEIDLEEVLHGVEPSIKIPKMRPCETCTGSGVAAGSRPESCEHCGGAGQRVFQQGFFRVNRACEVCGGSGEIIRDPCRDCRGAGRLEGQQTLQVRIPPGVDDGSRLRLVGEGEAGVSGGPAGDLYVVLNVRPHPLFQRDGTDLHIEVPVPFVQAALGGEVEVPTLEGKMSVPIPEGTQSGKVIPLGGHGLPPLQPRLEARQLAKMRGDLFVRLFVEVPSRLTDRQRELLEEFAEETGTEVSPVHRGFVEKLRDFFD
ncbi:MAG: molecular chaperone DnaJ [Myxococcota bacterium]|nr:molecular chaperone DnaJ [Myxococcota bacterium]